MVRQCAWCLCIIDDAGERISHAPFPKIYEATHGICGVCGVEWMEQVMQADEAEAAKHMQNAGDGSLFPEFERQSHETITQLVLQLQQNPDDLPPVPWLKQPKKTSSL